MKPRLLIYGIVVALVIVGLLALDAEGWFILFTYATPFVIAGVVYGLGWRFILGPEVQALSRRWFHALSLLLLLTACALPWLRTSARKQLYVDYLALRPGMSVAGVKAKMQNYERVESRDALRFSDPSTPDVDEIIVTLTSDGRRAQSVYFSPD